MDGGKLLLAWESSIEFPPSISLPKCVSMDRTGLSAQWPIWGPLRSVWPGIWSSRPNTPMPWQTLGP